MRKLMTLCIALFAVFSFSNASAAFYGTLGTCVGGTSALYDSSSTTPPTWSSSNPAVATVTSSGYYGMVTGHTAGTSIITCTRPTSVLIAVFTVSATPAAISGAGSPLCPGNTATMTCATPGGSWTSSAPMVAGISSSGVVTAVNAGTTIISYSVSLGCASTSTVTVNSIPVVDTIAGPASLCIGTSGTLSCTTPGGMWTSSNPLIVSVSSSGVISGVAAGSATISYTVPGSPCAGLRTRTVHCIGATSAGTVVGVWYVVAGSTTPYSSSASGGSWSSSNTSVATVSASGVVTGVAPGTSIISYGVSGCTGMAYDTAMITVLAPNCIRGNVLFGGTPYSGTVKVWLIKYNPTTHILYATDSVTTYSSGTSAPYSFCGMGTDTFRVKAAIDTSYTGTGYQPTYHTASAFWGTATTIYHVAGTLDAGKDINMNYGAVTSGPGFVAGDVTMGANKGTADPIPAVGLLVYCIDNATGAIIQQTKTNTAGHYSFSDLPVGTYKIYPELINYGTIPYPLLTLTASAPSVTAADFEQRTLSMQIVPVAIPTDVSTVGNAGTKLSIFPNPANKVVHVAWNMENAGKAVISIADVAGRNVLTTTVDMSASAGTASVPVSTLAKGIYLMHVKANGMNYTTKLTLE